jgi:trimeric autotransporter adhesin
VRAITAHGGALFVGGDFETAGDRPAGRAARWDGARWHAMGDNILDAWALGSHRDDLFLEGRVSTTAGQTAEGVSQWDGARWEPVRVLMDGSRSRRWVPSPSTTAIWS